MVATTPQSRKSKGRTFQQYVVAEILKHYVDLTGYDVWSISMGASGLDIKLSQSAREMFPFGIECKRKESINVHSDFKQARTNADKENLIPLLVSKRNREPALVTMEFETFMNIVNRLYLDECLIAGYRGRKIPTIKDVLDGKGRETEEYISPVREKILRGEL